ncbi:MAG: apolipoprotein N-acyltransferase, partial [Pseudomonadota bacterium]
DLTLANLDSDLIIWPEAAIPAFYSRVLDFLSVMSQDIKTTEASLLLGIPRHEDGRFYNSMVALGGEEPTFYDKRHLVPFGEYFPVPKFVREWMRLRNLPYSDYQSGESAQPPLQIAGQNIAVTICYEDVFGEEQLEHAEDVTLLVNVSNDAWFGDSIAPHQHLQIARMRAMEVRRFLLRTTNTGISAIISPGGVVADTIPQFKTAVLNGRVQGRQGVTPYASWGNWFIVVLSLVVLLTLGVLHRLKPS